MKKNLLKIIFPFILILVVYLAGCSSSSSGGGATPITESQAAAFIAQGLTAWTQSFNLTFLKPEGTITTNEGNGWFHIQANISSGGINLNVALHIQYLDAQGNIINDPDSQPGNVDGSKIYGTVACNISFGRTSESYTYTYGNGAANPFRMTGLLSSAKTLNGLMTIAYVSSSHTVSLVYNADNLQFPSSGQNHYPSGTTTVTVSYDGQQVFTATVVFNGTNTATVSFADGGTYSINLDDGTVTQIS